MLYLISIHIMYKSKVYLIAPPKVVNKKRFGGEIIDILRKGEYDIHMMNMKKIIGKI